MESGWQTLEHINGVEVGSQPGQRLLPLSHRNILLGSVHNPHFERLKLGVESILVILVRDLDLSEV